MDYIVVAHHADDVAETVFINLCRGTGIKGLTGIQPVNGHILRPLLHRSKTEIIDYIERNQLGYRVDSTNNSLDYVRNKIRHLILPVCKEINPSFLHTMQANCDTLQEVEQIYQYGIKQLEKEVVQEEKGEMLIHIQKTLATPAPYTLLYELLHPYGFNATQVEDILKSHAATPGKQFETGKYLLTKGRVYWRLFNTSEQADTSLSLTENGTYQLQNQTFTLTTEQISPDFSIPTASHVACFDLDKISYPLTIRHWKTGDWFCPLGMKRSRKKVSDLFNDLKFSTKQKRECLILLSGEDIIWVIGHRMDERYKITPKTRQILKIELS